MTLAYFDCFSGISGDMILGALVDGGVDIQLLRSELAKLDLTGYELTALKVRRAGISATKAHVCLEEKKPPPRHLSDITKIIETSGLSSSIKDTGIKIFGRLAEAEAKVHGTSVDHVHFHEVGAVDAIVDIVGAVIGMELLGITEVRSSAINLGSGSVATSHGILPVPAPATVELLKGIPCFGSSTPFELTTPTGAAILSTVSESFGPLPHIKSTTAAYGAGGRDIPGQPNVLRMIIGDSAEGLVEDKSVIIETNIDDMNPQIYDYLIDTLLQRGAHDVYLTPVIMKKGRPGILLSALTDSSDADAVLDTIFRETTSIGVRIHRVGRKKLVREIQEIETNYGKVGIKISKRGDEILTATPEYEDCRRIAKEKKIPLKQVMEEAKIQFSRNGTRE